jgi:hypothetical protein
MRKSNVYFVGTPAEVEHHIRPVAQELQIQIVDAGQIVNVAKAGDVAMFFSEHFDRFRQAITALKQNNVATIYMIDGILEWRNAWENRADEVACPFAMRPVLSHKVACIGENQARVLNGWGNFGKTEIVGVPRFDHYPMNKVAVVPTETDDRFRVLVMTAKTPAFTDSQWAIARQSILDCKSYADANAESVEFVWRLTGGLAEHAGVENSISDLTQTQLLDQLNSVDAVLCTPSTAVVESMLVGKPTALLNYFDCPSYLNLAWNVNHASQISAVIEQLKQPEDRKLHFQNQQLQQIVYRESPAARRLVELVRAMQQTAGRQITEGQRINFDAPILTLPESSPVAFDAKVMFPDTAEFAGDDVVQTQAQLAHARRQIDHLGCRIAQLESELKQAHEIFDEIHNHPIAGPVVRVRERMLAVLSNVKRKIQPES